MCKLFIGDNFRRGVDMLEMSSHRS